MLNSLEYLLPLCTVYRMVIISVDRWTNYCTEIGTGFFFFSFSYRSKTLSKTGCVKKIKKSVGGIVYIDLHNPESAVMQAMILAWIPKIIGRNCLLFFLLFYWNVSAGSYSKGPSPKRTEINWTFHFFFFTVHLEQRQLPWKYVFARENLVVILIVGIFI